MTIGVTANPGSMSQTTFCVHICRDVRMRLSSSPSLLLTLLFVLLSTPPSTTAIPIRTHLLWPPAPPSTPIPEVSVAQSADSRDSIIFATIIAFSAAIRIITSSLPLTSSPTPIILLLFLAAFLPTSLATVFAFASPTQRSFSWVWAQLVMLVALTGALSSFLAHPKGASDDEAAAPDHQLHATPLRDMRWQFHRPLLLPRLLLAVGLFVAVVAFTVLMEGWDVLALSFAAAVLVILGLEPKPRLVSPVFNNLPSGFPYRALAVRSLITARPSPLIYYYHRAPVGYNMLRFEHSIYQNDLLGRPGVRVLLAGLIGFSLIDNVQESSTTRNEQSDATSEDRASLTRERGTSSSSDSDDESERGGPIRTYPLRDIWPWLRVASIERLSNPDILSISISIMRHCSEFNDTTKLEAVCGFALVRAPRDPLKGLLALCSPLGGALTSSCLSHHHMNQLWSQWLEVHANYATSGAGYTFVPSEDNANSEDIRFITSTEIHARRRLRRPSDCDEGVVMTTASLSGGNPDLWSVRHTLSKDEEQILQGRTHHARATGGSTGGDWLTRVVCANQVDEIASSQEEWALQLGLPVAKASTVIANRLLRHKVGGADELVCEAGLIVPGPPYALMEAVHDRAFDEERELTASEAAWKALLAVMAFDVVAWGSAGVEDAAKQSQALRRVPASHQPRYISEGSVQRLILESFCECSGTAFLHTHVMQNCSSHFRGMHDYNTSQLHAFPIILPTEVKSLAGEIEVGLDDAEEDVIDEGILRDGELHLLAAERAAVLQLGMSSFFAISALFRAL